MESRSTYLLEHGIKPSVQRLALIDYLLTHRTHPTVDEMYEALHPSIPTLSRTTIYNTMKLFVDHGIALSIAIDEKMLKFDGDVSLHAHFLCLECNKLYDISVDESLAQELKNIDDNKIVNDVMLYYKGYCENCMNNKK